MNKFSKYLYLLLAIGGSTQLAAQQLPVMNHYIYNPYLYNPARTGQNEMGAVSVNFKRQWSSMPNAPITGALTVETPLPNTRLGVGGMFYTDKTHIINKIGGMASCAYHLPFSKDYMHRLSGGMSLGFINQRFNFQDATISNQADQQVLSTVSTGTSFDFNLGLDYQWRGLHVGVSLLQALNNPIKYITNNIDAVTFRNSLHFMFATSYKFEFGNNKEWAVEPTLMGRVIKATPFQMELNVLSSWRKMLFLGMGYRSSNNKSITSALMTSMGVDIKQRIFFGYSMEYAVSGKLNASMGLQHEFMVRFTFGEDKERARKIKQMDEEIASNKAKNQALDKQLQESKARLDSTAAAQQAMQDKINTQDQKISSLEKDLADKKAADAALAEEQRKRIQAQEEEAKRHKETLDQHTKELEEIRKKLGQKSPEFKRLGYVDFDMGKSSLSKVAQSQLDALKPTLVSKPNLQIYVYGHASTSGDKLTNMKLSNSRAAAVRQYLISIGVNGDNIEVLPFGSEDTNKGGTKDDKQDRRADIYVRE